MNRIRVFLVDDTAAVRHILTQILEEDPDIVVVGTASDGQQGLERLQRVEADLLILDVEMPGMGGLDMLKALKAQQSTLPVLVFSSITERGAMVTIEALSLGANDYVPKPAMVGTAAEARDYIRNSLLGKIKSLFKREPMVTEKPANITLTPSASSYRRIPSRVDLVVIGSSMGGPKALGEIMAALPDDFPVPVLMVQHMPAVFTKALAERLNQNSALSISECHQPTVIEAGQVLLAAGDYHMSVAREDGKIIATPLRSEPVNFCRPAVDVLFDAAALHFGANTLAVILTGMGQDGLEGCRKLADVGAQILVQDRASSTIWGMPGAVSRAGLATAEYPLMRMADEITRRVNRGRPTFRSRLDRLNSDNKHEVPG
ncbi:MAG: chemotaxis-specific protein-glutamate methyltransferase CheB [Pseudomonadota bacterium]|nr:chemotaxis-specific protein-glutamate methyltransferase CheB [Pseudomonadota bacterium]MEE3319075.1 chemotaxis-specific protein-glutamate methyltransferase CheB [Pseudomonadota bacterium]